MTTIAERDEQAMLAMTLRRQNMTIANIALYLGCKERWVYRLLNRARRLWGLLAEANDSQTRIGENLAAFEEMERVALEKFAKTEPNSAVAIGYLNAARDARKEIKRLQQEAGLMVKVPEKIEVTDLPLGKDAVRKAAYALLELARQEDKKTSGD